ncbi:MAG: TonB-dependent receptor [bacterium]|nr:TonB-dependent receptor [bacterium]
MRKSSVCSALPARVLLLALFGWAGVFAGNTGKIAGTVKDAGNKSPLIGVNVLVQGTSFGAVTDENGAYQILGLPPGSYALRLTMMGYRTTVVENIRVSIDFTTPMDVGMISTVIESDEAVTIVAEKPLVRKDMTGSLSTVGADEISNLPVRNVEDVLQLQAGVIRQGGDIHIRGGRRGEVAYWVDGVSTTDVFNGANGVSVETNSIQEMQVVSGTFNAEYGQAMSGIVKYITKEGGERFSGEISGYVGDYVSNDPIFNILKGWSPSTNAYTGVTTAAGRYENPLKKFNPVANGEATFSGPVPLTNKRVTFFTNARFLTDEGYLYGREFYTPQGHPGDSARVALNPSERYSAQAKLAFKLSPQMNLSYNVFLSRSHNDRLYSQANMYVPGAQPQQTSRSQTHILALNHVLSSKTFYELRLSRFRTQYEQYLYENPLATCKYRVSVEADANRGLPAFTFDPTTTEGQATLAQVQSDRRIIHYYTDPDGPTGYVHPDSNNTPTSYSLNRAGNSLFNIDRTTSYWVAKLDMTHQAGPIHQVKAGFDFRLHQLLLDQFTLQPRTEGDQTVVPFEPAIPELSSVDRQKYDRSPRELAAYVQDKIELKDLIVNLGLRFDYFDANSVIPSDPTDPSVYYPFKPEHIYRGYRAPDSPLSGADLTAWQSQFEKYTPEQRRAFMQKKVDAQMALSPRLGVSYPITDQGVIHFSYGHFFQMPEFQYLYSNPDFKMPAGGLGAGNQDLIFGNAALKPQKTTQYEIGLQQQILQDVGIDVTVFYRDVRDWVSTSNLISTVQPAVSYAKWENKDYANIRGLTFKLSKRYSNHFAAYVDYMYEVAEGTFSNPNEAFVATINRNEPRISLIPMAWDQRHTANGRVEFRTGSWTASLIGRYYTGTPYTPSFRTGEQVGGTATSALRENSMYKPAQKSVDLYLNRDFRLSGLRLGMFVNVYNLFDIRDNLNVYSDTGTADYTTQVNAASQPYDAKRVGTVYDWMRQPGWYMAPRQIQAGLSVGF